MGAWQVLEATMSVVGERGNETTEDQTPPTQDGKLVKLEA